MKETSEEFLKYWLKESISNSCNIFWKINLAYVPEVSVGGILQRISENFVLQNVVAIRETIHEVTPEGFFRKLLGGIQSGISEAW